MFVVIMISTAIIYSSLSMEQITQAAETIEIKQTSDLQKVDEEFEVVSVEIVSSKFNIDVTNIGDSPVHLTRLWVENTTDSTWPVSKYDIDYTIPSGSTTIDIGQNLDLFALDTESYQIKLVSERGNTEKTFLNSVGNDSVYLNLRATPTIVPTGFTTTLVLEVINTGTNKLVNLQAEMDSAVTSCTSSCSAVPDLGPTPASFASLDPGDIATFEWVYTINGDTTGDNVTFTASLVNGIDTDTAVVTIKHVETAENSGVSLDGGKVSDTAALDDSILLFHMEQDLVPSPGYQMASVEAEANAGLRIDMETKTVGNAFSVLTNNGSASTIIVPPGNWNASLALRSYAVPASLSDETEDLIFHFEDGDGVNPDNSEGDGNRDLEGCAASQFQERIQADNDDAEMDGSSGSMSESEDIELVRDGGNHQYAGFRWELDVPQGEVINSAYIMFHSDKADTGASPELKIGAQDTDDAATFNMGNTWDLRERWDGTIDDVTTAQIDWDNISGWDDGEEGPDTTTPDLSSIVQEIVNRPGWDSGNGIAFIIKDDSGGSNNNNREAENHNGGHQSISARLTVTYGSTGTPDWRPNEGPHGSGAYYYDGVTECHRSIQDVSSANGNAIEGNDATTSLWFKTDGTDLVSSEQMLVFWDGRGTYPSSDYWKISLGSDGTGKLLFEFDTDESNGTTTCLSANEYDKEQWYNVIAVRDESDDSCTMYIYNDSGVLQEDPPITGTKSGSGTAITHDAGDKMYVGSRAQVDDFFNGWIDDVMHWNSDELDSSEVADLSYTNYGDGAHQFIVNVDLVDEDGNFISNLHNVPAAAIEFQDSKGQADTVDAAYSMFNVTMALPQIQITNVQRLNFSMAFVSSTSTWEALEADMKIDDTDFTNFHPSYLQIPYPDSPFPGYLKYDPDDEMELHVSNIGTDGIYFVYSGTRLSFDNGNESFASHIHYINGTSASWAVDVDSDSIYIPPGEIAHMYFYANPTDHPCQGSGQSCQDANIVPDGNYRIAAWINGYTDKGESFGRSVVLGNAIVEDT